MADYNLINRPLSYYLGPEVTRIAQLAQMLNPVESIFGAMRSSQDMLAPGREPMQRVESLGDMLTGVAEAVTPVAGARVARVGADDAAQAVTEAFTGISGAPATRGAVEAGREFWADEAGSVGMSGRVARDFDVSRRDASDIFGEGSERVRYTDPQSGGTMEVVVRPDGRASVLELEVPEGFRGQGIGQSLQSRAMQDFPVMGGQVSSKAAAKTAYRLGRRPYGKPNATLEDVFRAIDENSSVNLVSAPAQPPSPAQEIADYLARGEADKVTDDMLAALTPNDNAELWRLYESGATGADMPMDTASRMARAEGMGSFPKDTYHATTNEIGAVDLAHSETGMSMGNNERAFWTSTQPKTTETYLPGAFVKEGLGGDPIGDGVERYYSPGSNIIPIRQHYNDAVVWEYGGGGYPQGGLGADLADAAAEGADTVVFRNMRDPGIMGLGQGNKNNTTVATFDPANIRSRFARFDPRLKHLSNLSAAVAPITLGALLAPPRAE